MSEKPSVAELLKELQASNDLLFGLLDYFEPGFELSQIQAQRDKNDRLIAKAREVPNA